LKRALGSDYLKVLSVLDDHLKKLDLQIKTVFEDDSVKKETPEQTGKARFYVTLRDGLDPNETKFCGWRIDDIAGLAISISYIMSRRGKAPREEVVELLKNKLPGWKVDINVNRYIRSGYLAEDENMQLYLDWRTRAEVDQKALLDLIISK